MAGDRDLVDPEDDEPGPVRVQVGSAVRYFAAGTSRTTVSDPALDVDVTVTIAVDADPPQLRIDAIDLTARDGGSITHDQQLPTTAQLRRVIARAVADMTYYVDPDAPVLPPLPTGDPTDPAWDAARRAWRDAMRGLDQRMAAFEAETVAAMRPRRQVRWTPEAYREVARLYAEAIEQGVPPRRHVAEAFGLASLNTARNVIAAARQETDPDTGRPYLAAPTTPKGDRP